MDVLCPYGSNWMTEIHAERLCYIMSPDRGDRGRERTHKMISDYRSWVANCFINFMNCRLRSGSKNRWVHARNSHIYSCKLQSCNDTDGSQWWKKALIWLTAKTAHLPLLDRDSRATVMPKTAATAVQTLQIMLTDFFHNSEFGIKWRILSLLRVLSLNHSPTFIMSSAVPSRKQSIWYRKHM